MMVFWSLLFVINSGSLALQISGDLKVLLETDNYEVWHLEIDPYVQGNLLYSGYRRLQSTDGNVSSLVTGGSNGYREGKGEKAQYRTISAFLNFNRTHVLMTDRFNHCLRFVNRDTNVSSTFAGNCKRMGQKDGNFTTAEFYEPMGITRYGSKIFVSDFRTRLIRMILLDTEYVFTFSDDSRLVWPRSLTFDSTGSRLFVVVNHGILEFNTETQACSSLTNLTEGFMDGDLANSQWEYPQQISLVDRNTLAVIDSGNIRLRLIDLEQNQVSSVCMGRQGDRLGPADTCQLRKPSSVTSDGANIYIGQPKKILEIGITSHIPTPVPSILTTGASLKTLKFEAAYDVTCSEITGVTERLIDAIGNKYGRDLQSFCRCNMVSMSRTCSNGLMKLDYLTNRKLASTDNLSTLSDAIREKQNESDAFFRMTVLTHTPPTINPVNSNGLVVTPRLVD